jgi:hypothetical protein
VVAFWRGRQRLRGLWSWRHKKGLQLVTSEDRLERIEQMPLYGAGRTGRLQTHSGAVKLVLAILAAAMLLVGCGHADPFVGTWKPGGFGETAVVAHATGNRYLLTQMHSTQADHAVTMVRRGDTLRGSFRQFTSGEWQTSTLTVTHLPDGHLTLKMDVLALDGSGTVPVATFVMSKVSTGSAAPTPSPEPTPFQGVGTKAFSSVALGISFRYPTSWRLTMNHTAADNGRVAVSPPGQTTSSAHLVVTVVFRRPSKAAPPFPFTDADSSQLARARAAMLEAGNVPIGAWLDPIGGLRLTHLDYYLGDGATRRRGFTVSSGRGQGRASSVHVEASGLESLRDTQTGLLFAILATMQFTGPRG